MAFVTGSSDDFVQTALGKYWQQDFPPWTSVPCSINQEGCQKTIPTVPSNFLFLFIERQAGWLYLLSSWKGQMTDSCCSIWFAHLGENKAASWVFTRVSKWDKAPLSGGHGSGPGQNHFQVSDHMITQDDLFKEESLQAQKKVNVYISPIIMHVLFP